MSKFRGFANRANEIAQTAFAELTAAENRLKEAEKQVKTYPQRSGAVTAEYAVMSAKANAALLEAREALHMAQMRMADYSHAIAGVRQELATALADEYSADPSKIDANALTLLQSGVLRSSEYSKLMQQFQTAENVTMTRLVGKYAADAAEKTARKYGDRDQRVTELRAVAYYGDTDDTNAVAAKLGEFDVLQEAFNRSVSNTSMIPYWSSLTSDTVENF